MKVIVIGCTHAGTAAVINCAKLYKDVEITVYEKNNNVSFLSCGIALYIGGIIKDVDGLFYSSPEKLSELGVNVRMKHEVIDVNTNEKKIIVKNLETNETFFDQYDKLVIAIGSWPVIPNLEGIKLENILLSKNYYHAETVIEKAKNVKNIVVIGAGYIGVELVEAFRENGKNVTLINSSDRILYKYYDKEFTDIAEAELKKHGVKLALGERVLRFEGQNGKVTHVITDKSSHEAELVILCIGFKPNTDLVKGQVNMLNNGAIEVDEFMRTSTRDVFAVGDCCTVKYNPTNEWRYIPLATNAVRTGTLAARNLMKPTIKYLGTQGTSGIKIYDYNLASTGLTEENAKELGIIYKTVAIHDSYRPEFMPTHDKALFKVIYKENSRIIIGAEICSTVDLTQHINTMSVIIYNKMTIDDLAFMDFFFQPHYNKPWNLLNQAGFKAE